MLNSKLFWLTWARFEKPWVFAFELHEKTDQARSQSKLLTSLCLEEGSWTTMSSDVETEDPPLFQKIACFTTFTRSISPTLVSRPSTLKVVSTPLMSVVKLVDYITVRTFIFIADCVNILQLQIVSKGGFVCSQFVMRPQNSSRLLNAEEQSKRHSVIGNNMGLKCTWK